MKKLIQSTFLVFMLLSVVPITLKAEKAKTEKERIELSKEETPCIT